MGFIAHGQGVLRSKNPFPADGGPVLLALRSGWDAGYDEAQAAGIERAKKMIRVEVDYTKVRPAGVTLRDHAAAMLFANLFPMQMTAMADHYKPASAAAAMQMYRDAADVAARLTRMGAEALLAELTSG